MLRFGAAVVGVVVTLSMSNAFAADDWYFAHIGPEACVPIEDMDLATGQRLYYRTGDMHTPEQVEQAFARLGFRVERDQEHSKPGLFAFNATTAGGVATSIVLVQGESMCKALMRYIRQ